MTWETEDMDHRTTAEVQGAIARNLRTVDRNLRLATFFTAWACLNCVVFLALKLT